MPLNPNNAATAVGGPKDNTALMVACLLGFIMFITTGIVAVAVAVPASANPSGIIAILTGQLALGIPLFVTAIVGGRNANRMEKVLNGAMSGKMQVVIDAALLRQDVRVQARADDTGRVTVVAADVPGESVTEPLPE